jgi:hypothetical protein
MFGPSTCTTSVSIGWNALTKSSAIIANVVPTRSAMPALADPPLARTSTSTTAITRRI